MTFFLLLSLWFSVFAHDNQPQSRWLVKVQSDGDKCLHDWCYKRQSLAEFIRIKDLPVDNWKLVILPEDQLPTLRKLPCVVQIREDKKLEWRDNEPNDPAYINQDDMDLIGMSKAWDIATGGLTVNGDTIVVALIDAGFQPEHEDLENNIWKNKGEIPDDNIDNDSNGYTDDHVGINISTGDDNHQPGAHHGTSVAGIVGAKGNNGIGIAGVNWDVRLMLISGADFESELIEAYEYVYEMRRKYRLTNGTQGAFVVATNLSGGVNNAFAEDHPLWCSMYDKLGEEGILSVTAAPNLSISVDEEGDMPTTCTSPFMIAVTNVDLTDVLLENAGFGPVSIDMGAPGHGTVTTGGNNSYREFPGTSAAAPHVTGSIALIYSAACSDFLENVNSDPDGLALTVRDILFDSGTPNNSLQDVTLTGKRLQTDAALRRTQDLCGIPTDHGLRILSVSPNPPAEHIVNVYFEPGTDTTSAFFELVSVNGSLIQTYYISALEFEQGYISIPTLPLAGGIYFITLRNKEEKSTARFFVP